MDNTRIGLSAAYLALAIVATGQLVVIMRTVGKQPGAWLTKKMFRVLLIIVSLFRALYFGLFQTYFEAASDANKFVQLYLPALASLLFFTAYMLVWAFWIRLSHSLGNQNTSYLITIQRRVSRAFVVINVFLYICELIFVVMFFLLGKGNAYVQLAAVQNMFFGALLFLWAVGFSWYGWSIYAKIRALPASRNRVSAPLQKIRKATAITLACTTCFLVRAVIVIVFSAPAFLRDPPSYTYILVLVSFTAGEIVPSLLILLLGSEIPAGRTPVGGGGGGSTGSVQSATDQGQDPLLDAFPFYVS